MISEWERMKHCNPFFIQSSSNNVLYPYFHLHGWIRENENGENVERKECNYYVYQRNKSFPKGQKSCRNAMKYFTDDVFIQVRFLETTLTQKHRSMSMKCIEEFFLHTLSVLQLQSVFLIVSPKIICHVTFLYILFEFGVYLLYIYILRRFD